MTVNRMPVCSAEHLACGADEWIDRHLLFGGAAQRSGRRRGRASRPHQGVRRTVGRRSGGAWLHRDSTCLTACSRARSFRSHCAFQLSTSMERTNQQRRLWTGVRRLVNALCYTVAAALADVLWKVDLRELVARLLSTCFKWLPSFTDALLCIPLIRSLWYALTGSHPRPLAADVGPDVRGPRGGCPSSTLGTECRTWVQRPRTHAAAARWSAYAPLPHQAKPPPTHRTARCCSSHAVAGCP